MTMIHPTAIVDPTARIAESVRIGAYCIVGPQVVIGEGTQLHNHVTIQSDTTIGIENIIYPYAVLGTDPQDRKFHGEHSVCTIGDRNQIRELVTIHRGTGNGGGKTCIGDDNLFMVAAHIAHDCILGNHIILANQVMLAGHVLVNDYANIGGGAGIHHFATIGQCSFVGGLTRINKDVPPFMIVEGNPAEVRAINNIAMTRHGYSPDHIEAVKGAFKRLYRENGMAMAEKLERLRNDSMEIPAVLCLCEALMATAEGMHGRAMELRRNDDKRSVEVSIPAGSSTHTEAEAKSV